MNDKYVYFIKPSGLEGPFKVGCSRHPLERLQSISLWSPLPLEIVLTTPGGHRMERGAHSYLSDLHSHHEWFRPGQILYSLLDRLRSGETLKEILADRVRSMPREYRRASHTHDKGRLLGYAAKVRSTTKHFTPPDEVYEVLQKWRSTYDTGVIDFDPADVEIVERYLSAPAYYCRGSRLRNGEVAA